MTGFKRNRRPLGFRIIGIILACLLLSVGCAMRPAHPVVELPADLPVAWAAETELDRLPLTTGLLGLLPDQCLRDLVREAIANNPDLGATALRLKAAQFLLVTPRSQFWPQLNAGYTKERNNQQVDEITGRQITLDSHRLALNINWEIDLWGRLADEYAAAVHSVRAQAHEYQLARDALAVRVIRAWIEQATIRAGLDIERERLQVLERIEVIAVDRYQNGIGTLDEYNVAQSRTEIARADMSVQEGALSRVMRKLEMLLGRYPRGQMLADGQLPALGTPPVDIPATALLKRPDIQAALAKVAFSRSAANAAHKTLAPQLRISGQLFKASAQLTRIATVSPYWEILGSLLQPLFQGGRIQAEARARDIEEQAALMELHQVVLIALKEVEDGLSAEHDLAHRIEALQLAMAASAKSSRYYTEQYRQGLDTIQSLLLAKEQEMAVKSRLNTTVAERLQNRIVLSLALGAGWCESPEPSAGDVAL